MVAGFMLVTTYPFDWAINHATLESHVASFDGRGILRSPGRPDWLREAIDTNTVRIDLEVAPAPAQQQGPARILTVSKDHYLRNLTIAHDGYDVHIRLRRDADTPNGVAPFIIPDVFREPGARTIRTTVQPGQIRAWIDGQLQLDAPLPETPMSFWDPTFSLALGNEFTWRRPWTGRISRAELHLPSQTIDLLSGSEVKRPSAWDRARVRGTSTKLDKLDALLNFLCLVPLGFLSASWLRRPSPGLVVLYWVPVTLTAEFLQVFLLVRYPSAFDLAANLLGIFVGAWIANARLVDVAPSES